MKQKNNIGQLLFWLFLTAIIGISCFFIGRTTTPPAEPEIAETVPTPTEAAAVNLEDDRRLRIDLEVDEDAPYAEFTPEDLGGNVEMPLTYNDVTNVSIEVGGEVLHLEDAIRDGKITVEELLAYARIDHRNGLCQERTKTSHSLTTFIYRYPKFDLRVVYDIYKSPDGKEHLIKDVDICDNAYDIVTVYSDDDGTPLSQEDWGLTIEPVSATHTSVTLRCTQAGGQQIGDLVTDIYWLDTPEGESLPRRPELGQANVDQYPKITIPRDTVSEITIDWTDIYGEILSGTYTFDLHLRDVFDPGQVHPLMDDYTDHQHYQVSFTIK